MTFPACQAGASVVDACEGLMDDAALVRGTTLSDASAVADRLVRASRRAGTTVSVGTTMVRPGTAPEQTKAMADRALYEAKAAGRDRAQAA